MATNVFSSPSTPVQGSFLQGIINSCNSSNATVLIASQLLPTQRIEVADPRDTLYAVDLEEMSVRIPSDEFEAQMDSSFLGSIFPNQGVVYSATTFLVGSMYPFCVNMRWISDSDALGTGIAR